MNDGLRTVFVMLHFLPLLSPSVERNIDAQRSRFRTMCTGALRIILDDIQVTLTPRHFSTRLNRHLFP